MERGRGRIEKQIGRCSKRSWPVRIAAMVLLLWIGAACSASQALRISEEEIASEAAASQAESSSGSLVDAALASSERLPEMTPVAAALPKLIVLERTAILAGDIELLGALWHADARIVDARGTTDMRDDHAWNGRAAILDRYLVAVFANPPPLLEEADVALQLAYAVDLADAPVDGVEVAGISGTDRWRFVWQDKRWWMFELIYGLPSP